MTGGLGDGGIIAAGFPIHRHIASIDQSTAGCFFPDTAGTALLGNTTPISNTSAMLDMGYDAHSNFNIFQFGILALCT